MNRRKSLKSPIRFLLCWYTRNDFGLWLNKSELDSFDWSFKAIPSPFRTDSNGLREGKQYLNELPSKWILRVREIFTVRDTP